MYHCQFLLTFFMVKHTTHYTISLHRSVIYIPRTSEWFTQRQTPNEHKRNMMCNIKLAGALVKASFTGNIYTEHSHKRKHLQSQSAKVMPSTQRWLVELCVSPTKNVLRSYSLWRKNAIYCISLSIHHHVSPACLCSMKRRSFLCFALWHFKFVNNFWGSRLRCAASNFFIM